MKICTKCGCAKELSAFYKRPQRLKTPYTSSCIACERRRQKGRKPSVAMQLKLNRKNPAMRARFVLKDSRTADRLKGRENDLSLPFITTAIAKGCAYCGATAQEARISLDRIDNALGHLCSNVVPACLNCNLTRGNMPYKAWLLVAEALKRAKELNLLQHWVRCK